MWNSRAAKAGRRRDGLSRRVKLLSLIIAGLVVGATRMSEAAPAEPEVAVPARTAPKPPALLPDLTPLRAKDMAIEMTERHRRLRFTAGLANIGRGALEVRPDNRRRCGRAERHASQVIYRDVDGDGRFIRNQDTVHTLRSAGCMIFHPRHAHWHFEAASRYRVYRPDREQDSIVRSRKVSFCLRDSERVPNRLGTFNKPLYYDGCSRDTPQGISTGWVDVYASYLAGQALPLPNRLPNGVYCLAIQLDPLDELWESDESNNESSRAFRLYGERVEPVKPNDCTSPE